MWAKMKTIFLLGVIFLFLNGLASCSGGGAILIVSDIKGPTLLDEQAYAEYSVEATGGTGITYLWHCNPFDAGEFFPPDGPATRFTPDHVTIDTPVEIWVMVNSSKSGTVLKKIDTVIKATTGIWASEIIGPFTVGANSSVGYRVEAGGDSGIGFEWTTTAPDLISFETPPAAETICRFGEPHVDTAVEISVAIWSDNNPVVSRIKIINIDTGDGIYIGGISGPMYVDENSTVDFSVDVTGSDEVTYDWYCDPPEAGSFSHPDMQTTGFTAGKFCNDFQTSIHVLVRLGDDEPLERSLGIIIRDTYAWVRTWGGNYKNRVYDVAVDSVCNIYVFGISKKVIDFDPGPGEDYLGTQYYSFLSKYGPKGEYRWTRIQSMSYEAPYLTKLIEATALVIDSADNIYITGNFEGIIDFNYSNPTDKYSSFNSASGISMFLCKFDPAGDFQFARVWSDQEFTYANNDMMGYGIALDGAGNIYMTGWFRGKMDFDVGESVTLLDSHETDTGHYSTDIFLIKLDPDAEFMWAGVIGGAGTEWGAAVSADNQGLVYIGGHFDKSVDFDPGGGTEEISPVGKRDAFLASYTTDGDLRWTRTFGEKNHYRTISAAVTDGSGNTYITLCRHSSYDETFEWVNLYKFNLEGSTLWQYEPSISGAILHIGLDKENAIYVASENYDIPSLHKINEDGNLQWVNLFGDSIDAYNSHGVYPYSVSIADSGGICVAGYYKGLVDFDPGPDDCYRYYNTSINGDGDAFLVKFDPEGGL